MAETVIEATPEAVLEAVLEEEKEDEEEEFVLVAIPIFKNVTALDFIGPYEVLHLLPHVKVVFFSHAKNSYMADLGMLSFRATATFDEVPGPGIIVVPGGGGVSELLTDTPLLDWIRKGSASSSLWQIDLRECELQGKIIGMTAGIDMALNLAALITDETSARVVQLMMEYDPQPPFNCGSVDHATPDTISRAKDWLENLDCWTICPDTACFFHSPAEVEPEDNVSTEEAAHESGDKTSEGAAPPEPKLALAAPFSDQELAERTPHLPLPDNHNDVSTEEPASLT